MSAVAACVTGRYRAGAQTIAINRIAGSEGRSLDFDLAFRPLHNHSRERWLGIAMAYQQGAALPPADLVQVGDVYFVRDGHHRISGARALSQRYIEAVVTVWQSRLV
ncbi:MAG TPA: hypothetical protein DEP84_36280 [Chloroflexi bacterium]|nr:hypothetical protein [Chloroflexota bacterium]